MPNKGAILLCGGRSSRMGRPKAWLAWRGKPMATAVAEVLSKVVDDVVVVRSAQVDPPPMPNGVRIVRDDYEALGPLAGIATGLRHSHADIAFVTGTDAPYLQPELVESILAYERAAAPVDEGFVQTLFAAYPKSASEMAQKLLFEGKRRPLDLLEACAYHPLKMDELPPGTKLAGFNTPSEYLAALREDGQNAPVLVDFVGAARLRVEKSRVEVRCGTLEEVLAQIPGTDDIKQAGEVAPPYLVSLGGRDFVRNLGLPVGPGERIVVLDAHAGG